MKGGKIMKKLLVLLTMIVTMFLIGCKGEFSPHDKIYEFELLSLRNGKNVSGSFILGTGSVGVHEFYYMFLKNNKDNSISRVKIQTFRVRIFEGVVTFSTRLTEFLLGRAVFGAVNLNL